MSSEEKIPRTLTLELIPMNDREYKRFVEWINDGLNDLRFASDQAVLTVPKIALKLDPVKKSEIQVVKHTVLIPKNRVTL